MNIKVPSPCCETKPLHVACGALGWEMLSASQPWFLTLLVSLLPQESHVMLGVSVFLSVKGAEVRLEPLLSVTWSSLPPTCLSSLMCAFFRSV